MGVPVRRLLGTLVAAGVGTLVAPLVAADGALETLLDKGSAYEVQFITNFRNVVAEETYVQEMTSPRRKRTLKSDFMFVRVPDVTAAMMLRDVFEVDGKQVRSDASAGRLMKLFTMPVRDIVGRARDIAEEGARYNLLDIGTINNPVAAMVFLQPEYRARFRFNLAGIEKDLGPTVRTVRFQEFRVPTIIKGNSNTDLPTRGLMWIDETTGRMVKTRLQVGLARTPPEIVTTYRHDAELGIDVPAEMRDWYPDGSRGEVRGVATYGRFRRFQVSTEETLK